MTLDLAPGVTLVSSRSRQELGNIDSFASRSVEWVVKAQAGATIGIVAYHPKGGRARFDLKL